MIPETSCETCWALGRVFSDTAQHETFLKRMHDIPDQHKICNGQLPNIVKEYNNNDKKIYRKKQ